MCRLASLDGERLAMEASLGFYEARAFASSKAEVPGVWPGGSGGRRGM